MTEEKPLRVLVAEALECSPYQPFNDPDIHVRHEWCCPCLVGSEHRVEGDSVVLPYGEDSPEGWACTGPLVQRFGIHVHPFPGGLWHAGTRATGLGPMCVDEACEHEIYHRASEAIARCVVAIKAAETK